MMPPVFTQLAAAPSVTALVGTAPVRVYPHGWAPAGVVSPYVTYSVPYSKPERGFGELPHTDYYRVEVDCWSDDPNQVLTLATAVRNALEVSNNLIGTTVNERDPETGRFRFSMQFAMWTART